MEVESPKGFVTPGSVVMSASVVVIFQDKVEGIYQSRGYQFYFQFEAAMVPSGGFRRLGVDFESLFLLCD
jgi:hypothetical protein